MAAGVAEQPRAHDWRGGWWTWARCGPTGRKGSEERGHVRSMGWRDAGVKSAMSAAGSTTGDEERWSARDPSMEVIALSSWAPLATNRFMCEVCNKGFQQNLQLPWRGHNLSWKLKPPWKCGGGCTCSWSQRACTTTHPGALHDLTGIKKHYCHKHNEKKWKCEKCNKHYTVQSDWKVHSKT